MNIRPNQPVFQVIGITLIVTIGGLAFGEVAEAVVSVTHTLIVAQAVVNYLFRRVVDKVACRVKVKGVPLCSGFLLLNPSQIVVLILRLVRCLKGLLWAMSTGLDKVTQFVIAVSAVDLWCILWIRKLSLLMGELT